MRLIWRVALTLVVGSLLPLAVVEAAEVQIRSIIDRPQTFDGATVTVRGIASVVVENVSRGGARFVTFEIRDGRGGAITVVAPGRPSVGTADAVEVTGVFRQLRRDGQAAVNAIDAVRVKAQMRSLVF